MRFDYLSILGATFKSSKTNKKKLGSDTCLNCGHKEEREFNFCPNCGQKARESKITLKVLIGEIFSNIFDLDSSFYRSFFLLPLPAYLSKKYVKGERKQYLNPIRFFFISMIMFFALLVSYLNTDNIDKITADQLARIEKSELLEKFEKELEKKEYDSLDQTNIDSLRASLFRGIVLPQLDTVFSTSPDNLVRIDLATEFKLLRRDLYHTPISEITADMKDEGWVKKILVQQFIRVTRDHKSALTFSLGNGIWVVIATIIMIAFLMKLFYIRRKKYLIEHAIILFHTHAFAFVVGSVIMLVAKFSDFGSEIYAIGAAVSLIYTILSLKFYYGQGWIKTLTKFLIISFFYVIVMSVLVGIVLMFSLLLFN